MLKLGDKIKVKSYLKRITYKTLPNECGVSEIGRCWVNYFVPDYSDCIVIGVRTLRDGIVEKDEDGRYFRPTKHFKALLVVSSLYKKPFLTRLPNEYA